MAADPDPDVAGTGTVRPAPDADSLEPVRRHPVYSVNRWLADHLGIAADLVPFCEFLSLAAGGMGLPVNLDVLTDRVAVDLNIAHRVFDLRPDQVWWIDTHRGLRAIERDGFRLPAPAAGPDQPDRPIAAVLVRGTHRHLHREAQEYTARVPAAGRHVPSLWRVTDRAADLPPLPTTLRVLAGQATRDLAGFGHAFARPRDDEGGRTLADLLGRLPYRPDYPCPFRDAFRGTVDPEEMLVFERLLTVFAALRLTLVDPADGRREVLPTDYDAARAFLTWLPLAPDDRDLSPRALATGELLLAAVRLHGGVELPDRSRDGPAWFTRQDAVRWSGHGYTSAKKYLDELAGEGIVVTTVAESNRERGRVIYYRFAAGREPPFGWRNPYAGLPDLPGEPPAP